MMIMNIRKNMKNQKGFTLVELMVVIAILGILATIGMTKMNDATASANGVKIVADLRMIDNAINMAQASGATVAAITAGPIGEPVSNYLDPVPTPPTNGKYVTKAQVTTPTDLLTGTGAVYLITADTNGNLRATYNGNNISQLNP